MPKIKNKPALNASGFKIPLRNAVTYSLYAFAALLPLWMHTGFYDVFEYPKLLALFGFVLLSLPLLPWMNWRLPHAKAIYLAFGIYLAVMTLSAVTGSDPYTGLWITNKRYFSLPYFLAILALFYWIGINLRSPRLALNFGHALLIPLLPLTAYAVGQYFGYDFMRWESDFGRAFASLGSPLHLSLYAATLAPLCLAGVWGSGALGRQLSFLGALLLCMTCLTLAYSRGSWLALGVGIYVVGYLACAPAPKRLHWDLGLGLLALAALCLLCVFQVAAYRPWTLGPVAAAVAGYGLFTYLGEGRLRALLLRLLLLFVAVFFMLSLSQPWWALGGLLLVMALAALSPADRMATLCIGLLIFAWPSFISYGTQRLNPRSGIYTQVADKITSLKLSRATVEESRFEMWQSARAWVRDYPWLGSGPQTTREIFSRYRTADYGRREGRMVPPNHMHSDYINIWVTQGSMGLLTWLALVSLLCYRGLQNAKYEFWVAGALGGMLVYLCAMAVGFPNVSTFTLFFMLAAVATLRAWIPAQALPETAPAFSPAGRWAMAVGLGSLGLLGFFPLAQNLSAEWQFKKGLTLHAGGHADQSVVPLEKAIMAQPRDAFYRSYAAEVYQDLFQQTRQTHYHDQAVASLKEAVRLRPSSSANLTRLADILAQSKDTLTDALVYYEQAQILDPLHPSIILNWGNALLQLERGREARQKYEQVLTMGDPTMVNRARYNLGLSYLRQGKRELALQILKAVDPTDADTMLSIALMLKEHGDQAGAQQRLRELTKKHPQFFEGRYELGILLLAQGMVLPALAEFKQALRLNSQNFAAQYNLGVAYWKNKQYELAKVHFRLAQNLEPQNPAIAALVKKIRF